MSALVQNDVDPMSAVYVFEYFQIILNHLPSRPCRAVDTFKHVIGNAGSYTETTLFCDTMEVEDRTRTVFSRVIHRFFH